MFQRKWQIIWCVQANVTPASGHSSLVFCHLTVVNCLLVLLGCVSDPLRAINWEATPCNTILRINIQNEKKSDYWNGLNLSLLDLNYLLTDLLPLKCIPTHSILPWMAAPRQKEPNEFIQGNFWLCSSHCVNLFLRVQLPWSRYPGLALILAYNITCYQCSQLSLLKPPASIQACRVLSHTINTLDCCSLCFPLHECECFSLKLCFAQFLPRKISVSAAAIWG